MSDNKLIPVSDGDTPRPRLRRLALPLAAGAAVAATAAAVALAATNKTASAPVPQPPMPPGMPHGDDAIHLEADVKATADNVYGYPDGAWVPYLTIEYRVEKQGADWHAEGKLRPMIAKDGPHYAENVKMPGPGRYTLTYRFAPPEANGFLRHTDQETGVPAWWQPFSESFTFDYPQK